MTEDLLVVADPLLKIIEPVLIEGLLYYIALYCIGSYCPLEPKVLSPAIANRCP